MVKLGRRPRIYDPRVPHMSMLLAGQVLAPPPPTVDYTRALPSDLGMMLNNTLGDCTCAAVYHALQVWTANANPPTDTEPDSNVLDLYERACGYVNGDSSTDNGGVEQEVLGFWLNSGIRVGSGTQNLSAFVEVDQRNTDDVKRAIADCGLVYIGFEVPAYLMSYTSAGSIWDVASTPQEQQNSSIIGGHAVVLAGYDANYVKVITWGVVVSMTWRFFAQYVDEVYALVNSDWVTATGKTILGMTLPELESTMDAIKYIPSDSIRRPPKPELSWFVDAGISVTRNVPTISAGVGVTL